MTRRLASTLLALTTVSALIVMACDSSEDETGTPTSEPTAAASATEPATEPATETPTSTATATATSEPSGGEPLLIAEAIVPAGFEDQLEAWVTPEGPADAAIPEQWDERAVVDGYLDYFQIPCEGVESVAVNDGMASFPADEGTRACFDEAMAGETPEAIAFLHQYGQFLIGFEETGTVDLGGTGAAWVNMGRGEPVLLNGAASMLPVTWLLYGGDASPVDTWLAEPAYAEAIADHDPIPWAEYTLIEQVEAPADGGQAFLLSIPLRDCRACEDLATIEVEYRFDADGALYEYALLLPGEPNAS